jgi:hypothetical protein
LPLRIAVSASIGAAACAILCVTTLSAQNRGLYPLGMSSVNSGGSTVAGFSYSNQLLIYGRDKSKDNSGATIATGANSVIMDLNSITWVSSKPILGGARFSATFTQPFAKNSLASDVSGTISGGGGLADTYVIPFVLGWSKERVNFRVLLGVLAPTGKYTPGADDNVGSGYWTPTLATGQTFQLGRQFVLSTFELYEWHTEQEGTGVMPGETFDLDYSLMRGFQMSGGSWLLQLGAAGYLARQTTARTGPTITAAQMQDRYAVNSLGLSSHVTIPKHKLNMGIRYFKEFSNRSTFEGYSLQFAGGIRF